MLLQIAWTAGQGADQEQTTACSTAGEYHLDMPLSVLAMDHIVLKVADVEASVVWYRDVLGLEPLRLQEWRDGEAPFASMRIDATTIIDLLAGDVDGVNMDHVALVIEGSLSDLEEIRASGEFEVVRGPNRLWGARGWGHGIYVRDPDGNTVELRTYD